MPRPPLPHTAGQKRFASIRREGGGADSFAADVCASGSRLSCWGEASVLSDRRPKRAPGPAQLFRGTARSVWSELGVQLGRCYRGRLFIARIRCLHATCRMPCMPDAVHEYADASRFASWGSTRHCSSVEGRTDPVARNNNVQPNKHCCMQCAAGSWCMLLAILACLTVRVNLTQSE